MLPWPEIALRLALAAVLGGAIGIERERKDWAAGLRTHMLVSMGSALIMLVSSFGFQDVVGKDYAELDPSRVAAQIVSGIGFIGAGAILFLKPATVLGLTTASGLWTVAGIGMATGGGMYFAAIVATVFSILILWALQPLQRLFTSKLQQKSLKIVAKGKTDPKVIINKLLEDEDVDFSNFSISRDSKDLIVELILEKPGNKKLIKITEHLQKEPYIKKTSWNK